MHFADLHDTPGRMEAKGVIRRQVLWAESRAFFYWRLRRRLLEFQLAASIPNTTSAPAGSRKDFVTALHEWCLHEAGGTVSLWESDREFVRWIEGKDIKAKLDLFISSKKASVLADTLAEQFSAISTVCGKETVTVQGVLTKALTRLSAEERKVMIEALQGLN